MAAAHDLLTFQEALEAINQPTVAHQDQLEQFVSGISSRVDALCGPVVQRTVTDERHNGGRKRVFLDLAHAASVTSVSEWANGTETVLTEETLSTQPDDAWLLDNAGAYSFIWRRSSGSDMIFAVGRRNVVVAYTAGRHADTASVDEAFKTAGSAVLRRLWKREQSSWAHTPDFFDDTENPRPSLTFFKAVDPMVRELLADELLPPVGM